MKVLYIVTAYDRRPGEGITPWLVETIRRLADEGVEIEVLAPSYRGLPSGRVDGVMVHRYRYAPGPIESLTHDQTAPDRVRQRPLFLGLVPAYVLSGALMARRLARQGGFDLVHAHWPLPHAVHGEAARRAAGVPLVLSFHGVELTFARRSRVPLLVPFLRRAIRIADAVTANSTYTAGLIRQLYDRPIDVIPFGSTITVAGAHGDGASDQAASGYRLLFVGRLVERKGVHVLLEAVSQARQTADVRLDVVGDGPLKTDLVEQARRLELGSAVSFHGFVPDQALGRFYRDADAFVLPAVHDAKGDVEGLGVVLIEALAHGTPTIASAAGGITDIVRDQETGLLVPPGDPAALRAAILALRADPGRAHALGAAGREHVRARFSWDAIIPRLATLYRDAVAGRAAA